MNLHNTTSQDLADELGTLKAAAADLRDRLQAIEAELIQRGEEVVEGALFRAVITAPTMRCSLDTKAISAAMPETWLVKFMRWSDVKASVRVSARTAARKAA